VKLLDANILLHAYNPDFPDHSMARAWLEAALSGQEPVALAWTTILAFLRICTNPRAFKSPLSPAEAGSVVSRWLERSQVTILQPGPRHWEILRPLLSTAQARADLVTDAHLAALALEHGAVVCTNDRDFARFQRVRTLDPLES
jgi:toxin-antitoxin system PIN domain toxin